MTVMHCYLHIQLVNIQQYYSSASETYSLGQQVETGRQIFLSKVV